MRKRSILVLARLRRVHGFLTGADVVAVAGDVQVWVRNLEVLIADLEGHGLGIDTKGREARLATAALHRATKEAQREYMLPVSKAARIIFHDKAMRAAFKVDHRLRRPAAIANALRGMAATASQYEDQFRTQLKADFVARMLAAADAIDAAIDARARAKGGRAGATAGTIGRARDARAHLKVLEDLVRPRLASHPTLLAEWKSLLRQDRVRERPRDKRRPRSEFKAAT